MTDKLFAQLINKSYFTAKQARALGIHPSLIAYYTKQGFFERLAHGIYRNVTVHPGEYFNMEDLLITAASISDGVICLVSALNYYKLTPEVPKYHWIAVPHYLRAPRRPLTRVIRTRNIELGREPFKIGEFETWIFDRERCVIDAFKYLDTETALKILKTYLKGGRNHQPDLRKLTHYTKLLRMPIQKYILAFTT